MAETYGPSNYEKRPQEGRSTIKKAPTPGQRDGEMEVVIWQARDLMEEQVSFALDRKELSPDAMLGLAWKISSEVINSRETTVWKKTILDHEALILHACEEYIKIPPAVIEQSVHAGDRVKKTAREPRKLAHIVIDYIDTLKGTSISPTDQEIKDHYAVGCLSDILNITAIFLDQQRKNKSN